MDRDELLRYLDTYLDTRTGKDYGPNGLQVEGRREVHKLVTGVSACRELFDQAVARGADAVLVHHGLLWDFQGALPLTGFHYRRVAALIHHDLNLFAYHLPLDRHPEVGNNFVAARALGLTELTPWAEFAGHPVGCRGRFATPLPAAELVLRAASFFGQAPLPFLHGPAAVATVALVSGAAQKELYAAIHQGLDAFLTGEVSEWVPNVAREAGIHYLACGHYATERCGIQALGQHLAERFALEVEFVEVANPV